MLDTPPLILQPGHNRLISFVALHRVVHSKFNPQTSARNAMNLQLQLRRPQQVGKRSEGFSSVMRRNQVVCTRGIACALKEVIGVVVVLRHAGANGEDVGVEDDVLGLEADRLHQDLERPRADAHLAA